MKIINLLGFYCLFSLLFCSAAIAQQKTVTGSITDETGMTLPGVTIKILDSTAGTISDYNGNYSIECKAENVLQFEFVGMRTERRTVGTNSIINVVMKEEATMLTETVVIGYGSAKKRDLTGSISSVKGADVANRPSSNPVASIQGKVAGVQITNTGKAGDTPDIRIRGTNSINGSKPLYVVDGLFNDNINFINPEDIESMEILKDPSSLAIFGVRGANGVIIITTKSAKEGKTVVNVNSSLGMKQVSKKMEMTDALQFKELYNEQRINENITTPYDYTNYQANTDWQDEIFQTGWMTYNNVSISGASEKNKFYMSIGYMMEEGVIKNEKMDKITINLNDEYIMNKNLKFGFQVSGYKANLANYKGVGAAVLAAPVSPVFNEEYQLYTALPDFQRSQISNPMVDIDLKSNTKPATEYRGIGNIYGELTFLKDFNFRIALSADYGFNQNREYIPLIAVYNPDIVNAAPIDSLEKITRIYQTQNVWAKTQSDFLLTYRKQIEDHSLTLTGGFTTYYRYMSEVSANRTQGSGQPIPNDERYWYVNLGDPSTSSNGSSQWDEATLSVLFRGLYNYKNKYLVNASYRRDGSSHFYPVGNAWENFGAIGAGWVMTEEDFMKNQSFLDFLKIKGSWGILGSPNIDETWRYPAYPEMQNTSSAVFGKEETVYPGYTPKYLYDSDLKWEKIHSWEAGFEANMIQNKFHIEALYFNKMTKGFLAIVPGLAGTVPGLKNLGDIKNQGVELSASWRATIGEDWTYSISGNLTTLDNTVYKYDNTVDMSRTNDGYPIGYFYGYKSIGVYQTQAEIDQSPVSTIGDVIPGDLKFADIDGDKKITTKDRTMIGNPTPDFTYGISLNIGYKNIDLSMDMMGVYGNEIFKNWNRNPYSQFNYQIERMDRWRGPGTSNWEPILSNERTNTKQASTYYIEDGSFFRIRNIQLGYNFSTSLLKSIRLQSLRFYLNAQNPVTFANNTGFTPEIGGSTVQFGVDNGTYPIPSVYTFGFNLSF